jgi:hypothetical protein
MMLASAFSTFALALALVGISATADGQAYASPTLLQGPTGPMQPDGTFELNGHRYRPWGVRLPDGDCQFGRPLQMSVPVTTIKCADISRAMINALITTRAILWQKEGDTLGSTPTIDLLRLGWLELDPAHTSERNTAITDAVAAAKRERQGVWFLRAD